MYKTTPYDEQLREVRKAVDSPFHCTVRLDLVVSDRKLDLPSVLRAVANGNTPAGESPHITVTAKAEGYSLSEIATYMDAMAGKITGKGTTAT